MEQKDFERTEEESLQPYIPRPKWQIWGARIALVVFIVVIIFYYLNIARGGA